jgi:hypothetical protein
LEQDYNIGDAVKGTKIGEAAQLSESLACAASPWHFFPDLKLGLHAWHLMLVNHAAAPP